MKNIFQLMIKKIENLFLSLDHLTDQNFIKILRFNFFNISILFLKMQI